jgi:hypothetical protein
MFLASGLLLAVWTLLRDSVNQMLLTLATLPLAAALGAVLLRGRGGGPTVTRGGSSACCSRPDRRTTADGHATAASAHSIAILVERLGGPRANRAARPLSRPSERLPPSGGVPSVCA